jgi:hypothetical protein
MVAVSFSNSWGSLPVPMPSTTSLLCFVTVTRRTNALPERLLTWALLAADQEYGDGNAVQISNPVVSCLLRIESFTIFARTAAF